MDPIEELTKKQLMEGFLSERWEYSSEDYGLALNQLLSALAKSGSLSDVLILVNSSIESVKFAGVWLAAIWGKEAASIFDEIKGLIHSDNKDIRYELMDCYLEFASSGRSVLDLVKCLDDDELSHRLKALNYIKFLSDSQIFSAYEYALKEEDSYCKYLSILKDIYEPEFVAAEIQKDLGSEDCLYKRFNYIAALRGGEGIDVLRNLARVSGDFDIKAYFERYENNKVRLG